MQKTRRGISADIMQCDGFIDLPATAQALYAQLILACDDEGFTASVSKSKIFAHATDEDVELLAKKRFIYVFENDGVKVVVIKHWRTSNWAKSGIVASAFSERKQVYVKPNGNYTLDPSKGKPLCTDVSDGHGCTRPTGTPAGIATDTSVPTQLNTTQYNPIQVNTKQPNGIQKAETHTCEDPDEEIDLDLGGTDQ